MRDGLKSLDTSRLVDAQIGAYSALEARIGRRNPALCVLLWSDVVFIKQAAKLKTGTIVHVPGILLRLNAEKTLDAHNTMVVSIDSSGDDHVMDELQLHPPMLLLNLATGMGVVREDAWINTPPGGVVPMHNNASQW